MQPYGNRPAVNTGLIYTDIYPLAIVASNQHLRVKFNNSADEDDEIWLLLTRHVVDTRRTSEYIALRVQIEDDTSPGSGLSDLADALRMLS